MLRIVRRVVRGGGSKLRESGRVLRSDGWELRGGSVVLRGVESVLRKEVTKVRREAKLLRAGVTVGVGRFFAWAANASDTVRRGTMRATSKG